MRMYTRDASADSNWAPVAIILVVLLVVLTINYFF